MKCPASFLATACGMVMLSLPAPAVAQCSNCNGAVSANVAAPAEPFSSDPGMLPPRAGAGNDPNLVRVDLAALPTASGAPNSLAALAQSAAPQAAAAPSAAPGSGGFDPCCPPWNADQLRSHLFFTVPNPITGNYGLRFNPSPQLHIQMNAYVNYLKSLGIGFNGIQLDFELLDGGNGATPGPFTGGGGPPPVGWGGTGTPVPNFFYGTPLVPNRWYRVKTTLTIWGGSGTAFVPPSCWVTYVDIRIQV
jgi:hypothetical protein